jgi:hypothetical protein
MLSSVMTPCVDGSGVGFVEGAADGAGVMVGAPVPPPPHAQHCSLAVKSVSS